jgi:hypothetical protein
MNIKDSQIIFQTYPIIPSPFDACLPRTSTVRGLPVGRGGGGQDEDFVGPPSSLSPPTERLCRNMKKPTFWKGGEAVEWKRFRAVTFSRIDPNMPKV